MAPLVYAGLTGCGGRLSAYRDGDRAGAVRIAVGRDADELPKEAGCCRADATVGRGNEGGGLALATLASNRGRRDLRYASCGRWERIVSMVSKAAMGRHSTVGSAARLGLRCTYRTTAAPGSAEPAEESGYARIQVPWLE